MAEPPPPPTPLTAMIREVFSTLGPFTSASNGAGAAASSNGAHSAMASVDATEVMAVDGGNDDDNDPLGLASLMDDDVNHEEHDGHAISGENNAENGQIPADKNVVVGDDAIENGDSSNSAKTSTTTNTTATTTTNTTSPKTTTRLNRALVTDLITASLKLYQDNYRLKKFFGNFKQYVGSYAEAATASESPAAKDISTISQKFITNLSAVHESLFNDSASLKRLMDRFNFSEYQSTVQDSWASESDPLIAGPSTSTSAGATASDAPEAPTGRCAVALANYLFSKAQRNAARLEHDPVYREILLDSILGPASSQPSSSSNDHSMVKEHALRTRSSRSSSSSSSAFTATLPSSYACHSCGGRFPYLDSLLSHLKREHDAPYQCFQCSLRFPSRILLNKHLESGKCNIGGDLPVRVRPLPANLFGKKRGRKPKEKVDLPPEVFTKVASKGTQTGPYGGKPGDRPLTQEEEGGATTYICPYCKIIFKRPINLSAHIKGVHVGDPGYAAAAAQVSLSEEVQELLAESEDEAEAGKKKKEGNPKAYLCRLCSRHFSRSIFLVDHIRAFHTENVCVSCNRQFKVRSTLNRHIKESDCARTAALPAIPTFSCGFCSIAPFKRIAHLNQHILRKHSADPSLEIVVEPFNGGNIKPTDLFPEELERLEVAVECRTCSLTFQRMTPFLTHLQAEHRAPEVGGAGLKCPHCKKTFKTRPSMATHVRESKCFRTEKLTGHMRPHRCRVCNKGFKLAPHLNLHMKNLHGWSKEGELGKKKGRKKKMANGKEEGEGDKEGANGGNGGDEGEEEEEGVPEGVETAFQEGDVEVILEEEGAASTAPKEKKKKKKAPSNRLYKCTWLACDFVSGDSLQVDEHRKVVHLGWKADAGVFSCVYCSGGNLTFPDTESVLAHLNKSHRARYKCNFNNGACPFQTGSLRELREHKASRHVKIRGFTCDWPDCTKVYVSPSLVAHHMRTAHKNERLLPCSWPGCGESFKKPLNLKNHLASHTTAATTASRSSTRRRRNETYAEQSGSEGTSGEMESAVSSILGGGGGGGHSSSMTASTSMMNQQQQQNQFQGFQTFNYDGPTTSFARQPGQQPSVTVVYNNTTGSSNSQQQYLQPNSQLHHHQQQTLGLQQSNQLFTNQQQQQQLQQMQQMLAGNHSLQALAQSHGSNVTSTAFQYLQQQQQQPTSFSYPQSSNMGGKSAGAAFSNSSNRAGGSQQLLHHCTLNGCTATFSDAASLNRHAEAVHLFSLITDSGGCQ